MSTQFFVAYYAPGLIMATFSRRGRSWRAGICKRGIRLQASFRSRKEAEDWAEAEESRIANCEPHPALRFPGAMPDGQLLDLGDLLLNSWSVAPICGVYFLIHVRDIVYVGQSKNIRQRLNKHWKDGGKIFDRVAFIECPESDLRNLESAYIQKFKPPLNVVGLGKGSIKYGYVQKAQEKLASRSMSQGGQAVGNVSDQG